MGNLMLTAHSLELGSIWIHWTRGRASANKKKWVWYFYRHQHKWVLDPTHLREYTADSQLTSLIKKHALKIIEQKKTPLVYTLALPFSFLRKIKIPIWGYYIWELVVQK